MVELSKVVSSNIEAIGWVDHHLYVRYKSGTVYNYSGVPKKVFEGLMSAQSKGTFMNESVKGIYEYTKE